MTYDDHETRELRAHYVWLASRQLLGKDWRLDANGLEPQTSIDRISWLLNGSFGIGAMLAAQQIIKNCKPTTAAREIVLLITMLDTSDINARKITQLWKAAGVDFDAINAAATAEIKRVQEQNE